MWAIYGYDNDDANTGSGSGDGSGYESQFGGDCADGCTDCGSCQVKAYIPHALVGVGILLLLGVV